MTKAEKTREDILTFARGEFARMGFRDASLRGIATGAGVTTGSIYRYFKNKDELFGAITQPARQAFFELHAGLSAETFQAAEAGAGFDKAADSAQITALLDMIYDSFEDYYLLVACAEGSAHDDFVQSFAKQEYESTLVYLNTLIRAHRSNFRVNEAAVRYAVEACVTAMFEPVRQRMEHAAATEQVRFLYRFFSNGWAGVEQDIIAAGSCEKQD